MQAQRPGEPDWFTEPGERVEGVMIGLYGGFVPGISVRGKEAYDGLEVETAWANSLGIQLGYGLTSRWLVYLNVDRSDHNTNNDFVARGLTSLHHVDIGVRHHFHLENERLIPYANLGVGMRQLYAKHARDTLNADRTVRIVLTARALSPGGGVHYFFSENFAVDGNLQLGIGAFNRVSPRGPRGRDLKTDSDMSFRLRVGIAWFPT